MFSSFVLVVTNAQGQTVALDSVFSLREQSKNNKLSIENRLSLAIKASQLSLKTDNDSTILNSNRNLSYLYLISGEYETFKLLSHENLDLAFKINDSIAIAASQSNLGWYYYAIGDDNVRVMNII